MDRRHRVGVALVVDSLPLGGAESLNLRVLSGLDPARFRPMAVCLREPGVMAEEYRRAGVPVHVLGRRGARHALTVPVLARLLRREGAGAVLLEPHHATMALAPAAARLAGAGTALGLHQIGGKHIGIPSFPHRSVEIAFLLDALVVLTRAQAEYLRREEGYGRFPWRRTRIAVIPNGIDVPPRPGPARRAAARRELGLDGEDLAVGILAALRPEKDHDLLLRAVARLAPAHGRLRLVLIGSGAREAELRALAEDLGIAGRTVFAGFRRDAVALLAGLDVSCLVSVQETFPTSVLEAMAAGLPVVTTDPPGVPDLVVEGVTGRRIPVGDEDALVARLGELLDDAGERARMGEAGRRRVETGFPLTRTVGRYEQLFAVIAGQGRRRHPGSPGPDILPGEG